MQPAGVRSFRLKPSASVGALALAAVTVLPRASLADEPRAPRPAVQAVGVAMAVAGVGVGGVSAFFGIRSNARWQELRDAGMRGERWSSSLQDAYDGAARDRLIAYSTLAGAIGLVGGGGIVFFVGSGSSQTSGASPAPTTRIAVTGTRLALSRSF